MSSTVRVTAELNAPPERVWEVVMDPARLEEWVTTHHALGEDAPKALREGSGFRQRMRLGGVKFTVDWRVTEADRPRRVVWAGTGPRGSSARVHYDLEPLEGGRTRFSYENEFELPGGAVGRVAVKLAGARAARHEAERTLANLSQLLS